MIFRPIAFFLLILIPKSLFAAQAVGWVGAQAQQQVVGVQKAADGLREQTKKQHRKSPTQRLKVACKEFYVEGRDAVKAEHLDEGELKGRWEVEFVAVLSFKGAGVYHQHFGTGKDLKSTIWRMSDAGTLEEDGRFELKLEKRASFTFNFDQQGALRFEELPAETKALYPVFVHFQFPGRGGVEFKDSETLKMTDERTGKTNTMTAVRSGDELFLFGTRHEGAYKFLLRLRRV